jgi:hypothetical protein
MKLRHCLLAAYLIVCALSLTGVLFRGLATADGLVLGLPRGLAWVTGWAVLTPIVLYVFELADEPEDSEESAS